MMHFPDRHFVLSPLHRYWRAWVLGTILLLSLWNGRAIAANAAESAVNLEQATARLQAIAEEMKQIRFCNRSTCRFREIEVDVAAAEDGSALYTGRIDARLDRPSAMLDVAHYNLAFEGDRWTLLGGEELSDVSSFSFAGSDYHVYSAYNGRSFSSNLANSNSSLRVGYRDLFFSVMDGGLERIADPT
ncbi:hypothetical protein [Synechococcus sp. PCC 7336]|uniref:hypothetical protein n=1 Tax=Synechococcus sp. PCC 7336 TaxID=195250 RepID=UPI00035F0FF2|nr:hypothetical protein [Synechococcus sp. PCC 7336]